MGVLKGLHSDHVDSRWEESTYSRLTFCKRSESYFFIINSAITLFSHCNFKRSLHRAIIIKMEVEERVFGQIPGIYVCDSLQSRLSVIDKFSSLHS